MEAPRHRHAQGGRLAARLRRRPTACSLAGTHGRGAYTLHEPRDSAALVVSKTDSGMPVGPGSTIDYTVTVKNIGNAAATGVTITDPVPGAHDVRVGRPRRRRRQCGGKVELERPDGPGGRAGAGALLGAGSRRPCRPSVTSDRQRRHRRQRCAGGVRPPAARTRPPIAPAHGLVGRAGLSRPAGPRWARRPATRCTSPTRATSRTATSSDAARGLAGDDLRRDLHDRRWRPRRRSLAGGVDRRVRQGRGARGCGGRRSRHGAPSPSPRGRPVGLGERRR